MALGSTSNMVNIEEAERGNIISKSTDKKLRRLEELITEKKVREERPSGRRENNVHERNGSYLQVEKMEFTLEPNMSSYDPGI